MDLAARNCPRAADAGDKLPTDSCAKAASFSAGGLGTNAGDKSAEWNYAGKDPDRAHGQETYSAGAQER